MYGSIFAGPALEHDNTPVVRYQDLHRTHAPASAGVPEIADLGSAREDAEYGTAFEFTERDDNRYAYRVDLDSTPPSVEITKAPMGRYTGKVTNSSDPEAYTAIIRLATEEATTQRGRTSIREKNGGKDDEGFDWESLASALGSGVSRGLGGGGKKKDTFRPSGRDSRPVSDKQLPVKEESKVGTYLLIGGASLLGIGILAAAIGASRRRGEE
jgi:hypothetical protein